MCVGQSQCICRLKQAVDHGQALKLSLGGDMVLYEVMVLWLVKTSGRNDPLL